MFPEKFVSLKRNSIIRQQFMRERLNLGSQSNTYTKISLRLVCCISLASESASGVMKSARRYDLARIK